MKPCRPPNSPLASAKPSCNFPRRVRKRSNNCNCYSENKVDSASGKAFALPGYGGLRRSGRTSVQDSLRLKKRFFRAGNLGYTNIRSPLSSTHRSIRLQFARRMGAQMDTLQWRHISCSLHIYYGASDHSSNLKRDHARAMNELARIGDVRSVFVFCFCFPMFVCQVKT